MKNLLTTSCLTILVGTMLYAPAYAAWYAKFDGVDGECKKAKNALLEIKAQEPEAVALLVPAVQKIREAAARMSDECEGRGGIDGDCATETLAKMMLAENPNKSKGLTLIELYSVGQGVHIKEVKITCRRVANAPSPEGLEDLLTGILIGLLREMNEQGMPESVTDPTKAALDAAHDIYDDPTGA